MFCVCSRLCLAKINVSLLNTMEYVRSNWFLFGLVVSLALWCQALPVGDLEENQNETSTDAVNETVPHDLYVIKTIVYEVGILTEADNDTDDNSTEISHQVDLTFYDPKFNGSTIDLSNIPLPIQTNISGVTITGFAPANLGSLVVPPPGESTVEPASDLPLTIPILPNAVVSVSHNISTTNPEKEAHLLSEIPAVLGLNSPFTEALQHVTSEKSSEVEDDDR